MNIENMVGIPYSYLSDATKINESNVDSVNCAGLVYLFFKQKGILLPKNLVRPFELYKSDALFETVNQGCESGDLLFYCQRKYYEKIKLFIPEFDLQFNLTKPFPIHVAVSLGESQNACERLLHADYRQGYSCVTSENQLFTRGLMYLLRKRLKAIIN